MLKGFRQYREIEKDEFFLVGCDTAAGLGDRCAAQFFSQKKLDVPLVYHSEQSATEMTTDLYPVLNKIYDVTRKKPTIAYERNNGGVFEMDRLALLNREGKFNIYHVQSFGQDETGATPKLGWDTNTATRPKMLSDLKDAIDNRLIKIYDQQTIKEMFSFIVVNTTSTRKAQAEKTAHDDLIMALAIAYQLAIGVKDVQPVKRRPVRYTGGDPITGYGATPVYERADEF